MLLPLLNYKGYHVTSEDGLITNEQLSTGDDKVMRIDIPEGTSGKISVRYVGFWYWRLGELMSFISLFILIILFYTDRKKESFVGLPVEIRTLIHNALVVCDEHHQGMLCPPFMLL